MSRQHKALIFALAGGAAAILIGVSCFWCASRPSPAVPPVKSPPSTPAALPAPAPTAPADGAAAPAPPRPSRPPRPAAAPVPDAGRPQCTRDQDCKGPRTADCIVPTCTDGKCVYDKSRCECRSAADCDDGDPCTRNHCFVPTMKCVFIKDGCK